MPGGLGSAEMRASAASTAGVVQSSLCPTISFTARSGTDPVWYNLRVGDRAGRRVQADLRAALRDDAAGWEQLGRFAEVGAASGHTVLAWTDPRMHLIGVAVALLEGVVAAGVTHSILAAYRPRYQILRRLDPAADSGPVVARLWGLTDDGLFSERLAELARVTARPS